MKVWILSNAGHDYSDAQRFGEVVDLFPKEAFPVWRPEKLKDYFDAQPLAEGDYLLLSGQLTVNVLVALWWYRKFGRINVLVFNAKTNKYQAREMP